MTDPEFADRTYIEPITAECVEKIIAREVGEMKRLNASGKLALLPPWAVKLRLIRPWLCFAAARWKNLRGNDRRQRRRIERGEDRQIFKDHMIKIGLDVPISGTAHNQEEARQVAEKIGQFPLIIRPAYTLGGTGGGIAYNRDEFEEIAKRGIELSPVRKFWSRNRCSAGRNMRWKSCATARTTASSSALSKL